jgi:HPt (histidine-containing phosphotransfer) domain-containing protein
LRPFTNLRIIVLMNFKLINTEYLEMVSGGDTEIIRELVNMFRDQTIDISREMRSCLKNNDYSSLGMLAHKAKSSVAIMGLNDLAEMLKVFDLQAKERKQIEHFEEYISRFDHDTKIAVEELNNYINNRL